MALHVSPIAYLNEMSASEKPFYRVIATSGPLFTTEVTFQGKRAIGLGPNKKASKTAAAEQLIVELTTNFDYKIEIFVVNGKIINNSRTSKNLVITNNNKSIFVEYMGSSFSSSDLVGPYLITTDDGELIAITDVTPDFIDKHCCT